MKTLLLPFKFLIFRLSRYLNKTFICPINYTYSINSECDSHCKTCNIWNNKRDDDLTTKEWKKIIKNIGNAPYWITISGGNQFLRSDFTKITHYIIKYNKPKIINIPISGLLPFKIQQNIISILKQLKNTNTKLILNLSLDSIGGKHDFIRGVKDSFNKTLKTYFLLKKLQKKHKNLIIGIYTIVSKYNEDDMANVIHFINKKLKPDHYGFEIAELRDEYSNLLMTFQPNNQKFINLLNNYLEIKKNKTKGIMRFKEIIRKSYYYYLKKILIEKKEIIPCFAGITSIEISSNGTIWQCPTKSKTLGTLRSENCDFRKMFFSKKANDIRKNIKQNHCFCTHSNPYYTNVLSMLRLK